MLRNQFPRYHELHPFEKNGGNVLFLGNYTGKSVDFTDILAKVKTVQPDVVFIPGYPRDSALVIKQGVNMGITATFLGGDAWGLRMFNYAEDTLNGSYAATVWHKDVPYPESRHLKRLFYEKHNSKFVYNSIIPMAYDAVVLFAQAVNKAGTLDRKRIRDVLARTVDFHGATGNITFDGIGDPIGKEVIIIKFENRISRFVKSVKEETIKIAALFALTGKAVESHKPSLEGVINAVNEINASGGITGKKIKFYVIDNHSTPIGSKIAADNAVEKNVTAIIAPL